MRNWLDLGNWNVVCDSCGRKFKASSLRKRWDGLMVCEEDFEVRHPQTLLKVAKERIAPPWVRPEVEPDVFLFYCDINGIQGRSDLGTADCSQADLNNPNILPPVPNVNDYPAIAGIAVAGISISGLIYTEQPPGA